MNNAALVEENAGISWVVASSHFAIELLNSYLPIVYPLLIAALGLSFEQVGRFPLLFSLFGALTQPLFGYFADRWHPGLIISVSMVWMGVAMGLVGWMNAYGAILLVGILGALASAAYHPAGAAMATMAVSRRQGASMSLFSVAGNLGAAGSPILIGIILARTGLPGTIILIPLGILFGFYYWRTLGVLDFSVDKRMPAKINDAANRQINWRSWLSIALLVLMVGSRSWLHGSMMNYIPAWLNGQGWSLDSAGSALATMMISIGVGSLAGGTLSDYVGRLPVAIVSTVLLIPIHWFFMHSVSWTTFFAAGLLGVSIGATFPLGILLAQEAMPNRVGLASSIMMGLGWMPAGVGAWVTGRIADQTSMTEALTWVGYVPIIGVIAILLFALQKRLGSRRES